jgi:hypothetical protein
LLLEQGAVRKTRERVVVGELPDRLRRLFLRREVHHEATDETRAPVRAGDGTSLVAPPTHARVRVHDAVLRGERLLGGPGVLVFHEDALAVARMDPARPRAGLGQPLGGGEAGHRLQLGADVDEVAVVVGPGDVRQGRNLLDQGAVEVLRVPQLPLALAGGSALGAVPQLPFDDLAEAAQAALREGVLGAGPHDLHQLVLSRGA